MIAALRLTGDVVGAVGFAVALVVMLMIPTRRGVNDNTIAKGVLAGAFAIYVVVCTSVVLGTFGLPLLTDVVEDNLEVIFPLLALGAVFAAYNDQQLADSARARRALAQQHDLMMDIVEAAPAGIIVLDPAGTITFANDAAKEILDLEEDPDTLALSGPGWVPDGAEGQRPGDLRALLATEPYEGRTVTLRWPTGWVVTLRASGRPMLDARGELGGVVVAFARPSEGA